MELIKGYERKEENLEAVIAAFEADGFKMDDYLKSIFKDFFLDKISYEEYVNKKLNYGKKQGFVDSSDEEIKAFAKSLV